MTTTLLQDETTRGAAPGGHSALNLALSAAIREYITAEGGAAYRKLYAEQVGGKAPLFIPDCKDCGGWPPSSEMAAILGRGPLRFGYVLTDPYVREDGHGGLTGLDVALGEELVRILRAHYQVDFPLLWLPAPAAQEGETPLATLFRGLVGSEYDAVLSGQMVLTGSDLPPGVDPDWTCATALIGPSINYTGKGGLDFSSIERKTRQDFIDFVARNYAVSPFVYFSVINPGPSTPAATALVGDLNGAGCAAFWTSGTVAESDDVIKNRKYAFTVGDCIASAWQVSQPGFTGLYLGIPAGRGTPSVADRTLMQVAPFTLKAQGDRT
jgi:hypothetical protein